MLAAKTIEKLNQLNSSRESILSGTKAEVLEFDRNNFSHLSTKMDAKACSLVKENIFMFTKETQLLHIEYFAVFTSIITTCKVNKFSQCRTHKCKRVWVENKLYNLSYQI
jgi:hypothetical protein